MVDPGARQTNGGYDYGLTGKCGQCFEVMCVDGREVHFAVSAQPESCLSFGYSNMSRKECSR